jgi:hypothetical protein
MDKNKQLVYSWASQDNPTAGQADLSRRALMHRSLVILFLFALTLIPSRALADPPKTTVTFAQGVTLPIALSSEPFGAPPSISEGVRVSRGVGSGAWSWMGEAGISTPFTAFTPSVYATTGPAQAFSKTFLLGEGISWKWTPSYGGAPASQALGVAVAPLFRVSFGSVTLPLGFACSVSATPTCSGSVGAKFLIKLNQ